MFSYLSFLLYKQKFVWNTAQWSSHDQVLIFPEKTLILPLFFSLQNKKIGSQNYTYLGKFKALHTS